MEHNRLQIGDVAKNSQGYFLVTSRALFNLATGKGCDFRIKEQTRKEWLIYLSINYQKSSLEEACYQKIFETGRKYGLQQALELTKR
ncbi:hypothetical protein M5361_13770 [Ligilactobacillus agilis]|nr:hypothetical protein [Ligilactobacillus agilis]